MLEIFECDRREVIWWPLRGALVCPFYNKTIDWNDIIKHSKKKVNRARKVPICSSVLIRKMWMFRNTQMFTDLKLIERNPNFIKSVQFIFSHHWILRNAMKKNFFVQPPYWNISVRSIFSFILLVYVPRPHHTTYRCRINFDVLTNERIVFTVHILPECEVLL